MSNNFDIEKYAAPPKKRCFFYAKNLNFVVQLVEHQSVKLNVESSSLSEIAKNGSLW